MLFPGKIFFEFFRVSRSSKSIDLLSMRLICNIFFGHGIMALRLKALETIRMLQVHKLNFRTIHLVHERMTRLSWRWAFHVGSCVVHVVKREKYAYEATTIVFKLSIFLPPNIAKIICPTYIRIRHRRRFFIRSWCVSSVKKKGHRQRGIVCHEKFRPGIKTTIVYLFAVFRSTCTYLKRILELWQTSHS